MDNQFYAVLDAASSRPVAFYASDAHGGPQGEEGSLVPAEAVPITELQWQEMLHHPSHCQFIDGEVVITEPVQDAPPPPRNAFDEIDALILRIEALEARNGV